MLIVGATVIAVGVVATANTGLGPLGDTEDTEFTEPFRSTEDLEPDPEGRFDDTHFTDDEKSAICEAMRDSAADFIDRDITTLDYGEPRNGPNSHCGAFESWDGEDYGDLHAFIYFHEYTADHIDEYETTVVDETKGGHEETTERTECWFLEQNFLDLEGAEARAFSQANYSDFATERDQHCISTSDSGAAGFFTTHQTLVSVEVLWPDEIVFNFEDDDVDHIYDEFEDIRDQLMIDVFAALP